MLVCVSCELPDQHRSRIVLDSATEFQQEQALVEGLSDSTVNAEGNTGGAVRFQMVRT